MAIVNQPAIIKYFPTSFNVNKSRHASQRLTNVNIRLTNFIGKSIEVITYPEKQ